MGTPACNASRTTSDFGSAVDCMPVARSRGVRTTPQMMASLSCDDLGRVNKPATRPANPSTAVPAWAASSASLAVSVYVAIEPFARNADSSLLNLHPLEGASPPLTSRKGKSNVKKSWLCGYSSQRRYWIEPTPRLTSHKASFLRQGVRQNATVKYLLLSVGSPTAVTSPCPISTQYTRSVQRHGIPCSVN